MGLVSQINIKPHKEPTKGTFIYNKSQVVEHIASALCFYRLAVYFAPFFLRYILGAKRGAHDILLLSIHKSGSKWLNNEPKANKRRKSKHLTPIFSII